MSLEVPDPRDEEMASSGNSQAEPAASQDISLFSDDAGPSPDPSSSPSISSFTHSSCSQSILKDVNPIVSSDSKVVGQIPPSGSNVVNLSSNSNVEGPKVARGNSNSNGSKGVSNSSGSSILKGAKAALNKLSPIGSSNFQIPNSQDSAVASQASQIVQHDFLSTVGRPVDSDSSSDDSSFKPPVPPKPRCNIPQASQSPQRACSRSPHVGGSPGSHKSMPQALPVRLS